MAQQKQQQLKLVDDKVGFSGYNFMCCPIVHRAPSEIPLSLPAKDDSKPAPLRLLEIESAPDEDTSTQLNRRTKSFLSHLSFKSKRSTTSDPEDQDVDVCDNGSLADKKIGVVELLSRSRSHLSTRSKLSKPGNIDELDEEVEFHLPTFGQEQEHDHRKRRG